MEVVVNIQMIATCIAIITAAAGVVAFGYKLYKRFDDLPQRVSSLEKITTACHAKSVDFDILNNSINSIQSKLQDDAASINHITDCQIIMMESLVNMFQHIINGNHSREMQSSYNKMVKELMRINTERDTNAS